VYTFNAAVADFEEHVKAVQAGSAVFQLGVGNSHLALLAARAPAAQHGV